MTHADIIAKLPYDAPFLFVDGLTTVSDKEIEGHYRFVKDAHFYRGHFKDYPVTPGVLITECMAQIGLVCLGIYLMKDRELSDSQGFFMTHNAIDFLKPLYPDTTLTVKATKMYFRFGKLKCSVVAYDERGSEIAKGTISGMLTSPNETA